MKTKRLTKFGAVLSAALVLFSGILSVSAASVPQAVIDTDRKASVSLYKYDFTSAHADGVLGDNTYISTGYADENVENALMPYAIEGVVFSYAKIADLAVHAETKDGKHQNMLLYKLPGGDKTTALMNYLDLTSEDAYKTDRGDLYFTSDTLIDALSNHLNTAESQTKNALEAFIRQNGTSMPETDGTGHTSAAELEQGLYLFVETQVPETVSNTTAPFLLSLPMTSIDGMNWNYDVTVYPKNERTAPTLEKTLRESKADTGKNDGTDSITDGYAHTATGSIGDVIEYQILSALPSITSRATSFSEYTYTDTLSAGLSYRKNDVRIEWFSDKSCTEESRVAVWTEQDGKFAVSYSALGDESVMRIKMTDAGLEELNNSDAVYDPNTSLYRGYSGCTMRITYTASVSATPVYGDIGNPNAVTLMWSRTNTAYSNTLTDDCHFYVYGLDLLKLFSDNLGDYSKVQFKLYNTTDGYWVTANSDDNGNYLVSGHAEREDDASVLTPGSSGHLFLKGLEDDIYRVTEINTDANYTLLGNFITVEIRAKESGKICGTCGKSELTAEAFENGNAKDMNDDNGSASAIVPIRVMNTRGYRLPKTGDAGTTLLAAGGMTLAVLSAAAVALLLVFKKKDKFDD